MDKKIRKRDILIKALALLVAVGLWVYVSYVEIPEIEVKYYNIPITYKNDDSLKASQLIRDTDSETQTVTIKVKGKRSKIFSLSSHDITAKVDLSGLSYASTYTLPVTITFPVDGFTVVDKKPYSVPVKIEKAIVKELPVFVEVTGTVDSSCKLAKKMLSADTIKVSGPESVIDNVQSCIAAVNVDGLSEDRELPAELKFNMEDGSVLSDKSKILYDGQITVLAELYKTIKIQIQPTIENTSALSIKNTKVTPNEVEIAGTYKDIAKLNGVLGTEKIILDDSAGTKNYEVELDIPEGIRVVGNEKTAEVEIELEKEEANE